MRKYPQTSSPRACHIVMLSKSQGFHTSNIEGHSDQRKQHIQRERVSDLNYGDVLVSSGCVTKCPRLQGSNNRELLLHSSGGLKVKIKVLAEWLLLRAEGLQWER